MAMDKRILLLNGPAGSGKDTIGQQFIKDYSHVGMIKVRKFAEPLKRAVGSFFNLTPVEFDFYFETQEGKSTKSDRFFGKTPREWLISFSEDFAKINGGKGVFGRILAEEIKKDFKQGWSTIIITDSGFMEEAQELLNAFGNEVDVWLIKLMRSGYNFTGDSRSYLPTTQFDLTLEVNNDNPIHMTMKQIYEKVLV